MAAVPRATLWRGFKTGGAWLHPLASMDIDSIVKDLKSRLHGEEVADDAFRRAIVHRYNLGFGDHPEDWEEYGEPDTTPVALRFEPLDPKERRALREVGAILEERWGRGLPPAYLQLLEQHGLLRGVLKGTPPHSFGFWAPSPHG